MSHAGPTMFERLLTDVRDRDRTTGCWTDGPWCLDDNGYGLVRYPASMGGKVIRAHRAAAIAAGVLTTDLDGLHRCDNPPCYNPDHIFAGTQGDNNADRNAKHRHSFGERQGRAKLTDAAVREARERAASGAPIAELAREYGVIYRTIQLAVERKTWRHVA